MGQCSQVRRLGPCEPRRAPLLLGGPCDPRENVPPRVASLRRRSSSVASIARGSTRAASRADSRARRCFSSSRLVLAAASASFSAAPWRLAMTGARARSGAACCEDDAGTAPAIVRLITLFIAAANPLPTPPMLPPAAATASTANKDASVAASFPASSATASDETAEERPRSSLRTTPPLLRPATRLPSLRLPPRLPLPPPLPPPLLPPLLGPTLIPPSRARLPLG